MKGLELQETLRELDRQGVWIITRPQLNVLFPDENNAALTQSIKRHSQSGILVPLARGVFMNPHAKCRSAYPLEHLAGILRARAVNYVSAENVLSELGVISQMPQNYLVVMTTGKSKTYNTPIGTLELVHTKRDPRDFKGQLNFDPERKIWVANANIAYRDLKRLGRNVGLVDVDMLREAIEEQGA